MSDTIYWAVKLDMESVAKLVSHFPPRHPNVYAEHVTVAFSPTEEQERQLVPQCGQAVSLQVVAVAQDDKGQAVVVSGVDRLNPGTPHITISCADGVRPVYSNTLLSKGEREVVSGPTLNGVMARYTKRGWDTSCEELKEESGESTEPTGEQA